LIVRSQRASYADMQLRQLADLTAISAFAIMLALLLVEWWDRLVFPV